MDLDAKVVPQLSHIDAQTHHKLNAQTGNGKDQWNHKNIFLNGQII